MRRCGTCGTRSGQPVWHAEGTVSGSEGTLHTIYLTPAVTQMHPCRASESTPTPAPPPSTLITEAPLHLHLQSPLLTHTHQASTWHFTNHHHPITHHSVSLPAPPPCPAVVVVPAPAPQQVLAAPTPAPAPTAVAAVPTTPTVVGSGGIKVVTSTPVSISNPITVSRG